MGYCCWSRRRKVEVEEKLSPDLRMAPTKTEQSTVCVDVRLKGKAEISLVSFHRVKSHFYQRRTPTLVL